MHHLAVVITFLGFISPCACSGSGICRRLTCSPKGIGVARVSHRASASARGSYEAATGSRAQAEPSRTVQDVGPSFRFMAEGNMWMLDFDASGLRVLADPWLVGSQTFWDQAWLYTGASSPHQFFFRPWLRSSFLCRLRHLTFRFC